MNTLHRGLCLTVLAMFTFVIGVTTVNAQSNSLGINPRKDFTIQPGETAKDTLFISNLSKDQPLKLKIRVIDFKAQDETGAPQLDRRENVEPTSWSLRPFIDIPAETTVQPNKPVQLPFSISIPKNQGAGSYYSAIEYVVTSAGSENVNVAASSATLIFVKVPGETKQLLRLEQFGTFVAADNSSDGQFKSIFSKEPPKEAAYRLKNEGNVAEQPKGTIIVKDILGKQVAAVSDVNPKNSVALLGQTRRFQICLDSEKRKVTNQANQETEVESCKPLNLKPGRYTMDLALFYGENGNDTREINASAVFWYLPKWFVAVLLVALLAIAAGGYFLYRKVSSRRRPRRR